MYLLFLSSPDYCRYGNLGVGLTYVMPIYDGRLGHGSWCRHLAECDVCDVELGVVRLVLVQLE